MNKGRVPRRALPNNDGMCLRCKPPPCSVSGCTAKVSRMYEHLFLCKQHGAASNIQKTGVQPALAALPSRTERACDIGSGKRLRSHRRDSSSLVCSVSWCQRLGKRHIVSGSRDSLVLCSTHTAWYVRNEHHPRSGFRHGYLAAACPIEEYVCGRIQSAQLSSTGNFTETCPWCAALYFCDEAVVSSGGKRRRLCFTRCCHRGDLAPLPTLPDAPRLLQCLFTGQITHDDAALQVPVRHPFKSWRDLSQHFIDNVRAYNCAMSFCSYSDEQSCWVWGL